MTNTENPLGIIALDHLEFTAEDLSSPTKNLFHQLGFQQTSYNQELQSETYQQGQIRFYLTTSKDQNLQSRKYFNQHGEGVCKISFLVENAEFALNNAIKRGAQLKQDLKTFESNSGSYKSGAIQGFGDVLNEFIERPQGNDFFKVGYTKITSDTKAMPLKVRCSRIDHLTNNVPKGQMEHWVDFYQRIYGFKVTRYFDIKGLKTGLFSKVVQSHNNQIIIPINEPEVENGKSQIQEFLDVHKGAGVQHIALMTPDIISTISELQSRGLNFLQTPHTYYEDIPKRKISVEESLEILEQHKILVDGEQKEYLLQIFSQNYVGPLFFEFIQRKNHWGFGEGNFQALFDSIERDQMQRGYLK